MTDESLDALNARVDELIALYAAVKQENRLLKDSQSAWHAERQQLVRKNQEAKIELQSILNRLKAMAGQVQ